MRASARFGNRRIESELARHGVALDSASSDALRASELARAREVWGKRVRRFAGRCRRTRAADALPGRAGLLDRSHQSSDARRRGRLDLGQRFGAKHRATLPAVLHLRHVAGAPVLPAQSSERFMPLPPAAPDRMLKHRRSIDVQVYARGNGLWEVDARLTDTKTRDAHAGRRRAAGRRADP